jgi:hypothetical protein
MRIAVTTIGLLMLGGLIAKSAISQVATQEVDAAKLKAPNATWIDPVILKKLQGIQPQKPMDSMSILQQRKVLNKLKDRGASLLASMDGATILSVAPSTAAKELPEMQGLAQPVMIAKGITRIPRDIRGYSGPLNGLPIDVVTDMDGKPLRIALTLPKTGYIGFNGKENVPITPDSALR